MRERSKTSAYRNVAGLAEIKKCLKIFVQLMNISYLKAKPKPHRTGERVGQQRNKNAYEMTRAEIKCSKNH